MCCGHSNYDPKNWANASNPYYRELLSDINTGASAWLDWNMLLSWQGGPSYCGNYCASPVIMNEAGDGFILTPIYDALKKFSQMFPAGSKVIRCEISSDQVAAVARKVGKNYEVVVANVSDDDKNQDVTIRLGGVEKQISLKKLEIKKFTF
jgi:glucosylceramidase